MAIIIPECVLESATTVFDLDPRSLRPLERGGAPDGAVYQCQHEGRDLFFKIKPMSGSAAAERDRVVFVDRLRAGGIVVPEFVRSTRGTTLEIVETEDTAYSVTLTVKAPGRHIEFPRDWTPSLIHAWGRTLGRMHAIAAAFEGAPSLADWREEVTGFRSDCHDEEIGAVWQEIAETLETLPHDSSNFGIIHNDLHIGNLMLIDPDWEDEGGGTGLIVLDFDVSARHWFVTDLAIALVHPLWQMRQHHPEEMASFVADFMAAYAEEYQLEPEWLARLPLFMRYRMTLIVLAMSRELGYPGSLPTRIAEIRAWVLSGEPLADLALG